MAEPYASAGSVLEIDLGALVANWRQLRDLHGQGRDTAAVLKADGYGLGASRVASALYKAGCRHIFTAHLMEAVAIRHSAPDAMLSVLHGLGPGEERDFIAHRLVPALGSLAEIEAWGRAAAGLGQPLPALLHIDTGMNRTGLSPEALARLIAEPTRLQGIDLRYVMTHLVSADIPGAPINLQQARRFAAVAAHFPTAQRCFANSSGLFLGPDFASDLARPGAALYGINPIPDAPNPMRAVARLSARIMQIRDIPAGESVGYDRQWVATRPSRIATLPIGYADGYHRALSGKAAVAFGGQLCPVVGRISMDLITVDVTDCPAAVLGAWMEVIGPTIPPERLARLAGTNAYEILTSLGRRFHRVYLEA
ncbi:alanine racemase [Acidisoma cellulosilytica]|uniref:Alanine racemase n=1 Tax=Acidisoma cellulosilyticum TaxID=2802395 RepID=A0A963YYN7_9PROT|nr:alanine racemase [Acidisoma cellulosilyticum]